VLKKFGSSHKNSLFCGTWRLFEFNPKGQKSKFCFRLRAFYRMKGYRKILSVKVQTNDALKRNISLQPGTNLFVPANVFLILHLIVVSEHQLGIKVF